MIGGGLSADGFNSDAIDCRPAECLGALRYGKVCRYLPALWRREQHTHSQSSLVQAAIAPGAMVEACQIMQSEGSSFGIIKAAFMYNLL